MCLLARRPNEVAAQHRQLTEYSVTSPKQTECSVGFKEGGAGGCRVPGRVSGQRAGRRVAAAARAGAGVPGEHAPAVESVERRDRGRPGRCPRAGAGGDRRARARRVRRGDRGRRCAGSVVSAERSAAEAVLVWAHGGGWTHGDLDTCEGVARALANRAGCAVVAVDYRLAPEYPFPAGFEECGGRSRGRGAPSRRSPSVGTARAATWRPRRRSTPVTAGVELTVQLLVYPVLDSTQDADYKLASGSGTQPSPGMQVTGQTATIGSRTSGRPTSPTQRCARCRTHPRCTRRRCAAWHQR